MIQEATTQTRERSTNPIGMSDAMRRVKRDALLASYVNPHVLISGPSHMANADLARFVHDRSRRSFHGFRQIDCGCPSEVLIESALFGHELASFPGAYADQRGSIESIPGGTILLKNIHTLGPRMQAKLLRWLETGEYQRVGGVTVQTNRNVRVIATTNADLAARVASGMFLTDLYRQLSFIRLTLPPQRESSGDTSAEWFRSIA